MRARSSTLAYLLLGAALGAACGSAPAAKASAAPSKTPQRLAISAIPRQQPPPTTQDFIAAADLVASTGVRAGYESITWKDLEPATGLAKEKDALAYLGRSREWDLLFGVKVIDTTVKAVPPDLLAVAFDSPVMQRRFHALIDAMRPIVKEHVRYLSIGNEVDAYLSAHPDQWAAYRRFYADAVGYVHSVLPGILVGVTSIFDHASGAARSEISALAQLSDVSIFTYYPLGDRFVPRPPETATDDILEMVTLAQGRPVVIQEVGYPSAAQLSSSERSQAAFVTRVLDAWRRAGVRIPFLNWFALHDFTTAMCQQFGTYYGLPGDANFKAYLCSLGLRRVDGSPKLAWQAMMDDQRTG